MRAGAVYREVTDRPRVDDIDATHTARRAVGRHRVTVLSLAVRASVHPHDAQDDCTKQAVLHRAGKQEPAGTAHQRRHDVGLPAFRLDVWNVRSGDSVLRGVRYC